MWKEDRTPREGLDGRTTNATLSAPESRHFLNGGILIVHLSNRCVTVSLSLLSFMLILLFMFIVLCVTVICLHLGSLLTLYRYLACILKPK